MVQSVLKEDSVSQEGKGGKSRPYLPGTAVKADELNPGISVTQS